MTESEFKKLVSEFTDEKLTVTFGGTCGWYDFSYMKKIFNYDHFHALHKWKDTMNDATRIIGTDKMPELNDSRTYIYGYGNFTWVDVNDKNSIEKAINIATSYNNLDDQERRKRRNSFN